MSPPNRFLICALLLGSALIIAGAGKGDPGKKMQNNSCVRCHSELPDSNFLGVKSHSWTGSIHAKRGVTCDKCHGGNPAAASKAEAHAGNLGSSDTQSPVYYKNIPATCGKCHGAEFYEFRQSLHYKMLESAGKGPECVTCHGSMVTSVLTPATVAAVCQRCHNERMGIFPYIPQKAKAVLLLLRTSEELLAAQEKLYPPEKEGDHADHITEARSALHSAELEWHRFDLDKVTEYLQKMYNDLKISRKH